MKNLFHLVILSAATMVSCTCGNGGKGNGCAEESACRDALTIIATLKANPDFKTELWDAVGKVVEGTRAEDGNIAYKVYVDTTDSLKLTFIEHWRSQAAIDAHNSSEHFRTFAKAVEGKAELSVILLRPAF